MIKKSLAVLVIVVAAAGAGALAGGYAFAQDSGTGGGAAAPKNLKILPKTLTKPELKKLMKGIASSLGVECDYCHKEEDFAADTEKKETARKMMQMVSELNTKHFGGKPRVGCITCHNGQKEPKKP
jgi:photosynthetic reaction center cytochrome c subunit